VVGRAGGLGGPGLGGPAAGFGGACGSAAAATQSMARAIAPANSARVAVPLLVLIISCRMWKTAVNADHHVDHEPGVV